MTRELVTVSPKTTLEELTELFLRTNRHAFPVLDDEQRLCGIVSLSDLRAANHGSSEEILVGEIMKRSVITAYPDETLDAVLARMGPKDLSRLPVVTREDPRRVLAVVRRNDIVRAYNLAVAREAASS